MVRECDGCGRKVKLGRAFANIWDFDQQPTRGVTLELADGSEHLLCEACINELPDDRELIAEDVAALSSDRSC